MLMLLVEEKTNILLHIKSGYEHYRIILTNLLEDKIKKIIYIINEQK